MIILELSEAHGVLDTYSSSEVKRIYFARENDPIDQLSDQKWTRVAERIKRESDDLVKAIYLWADEYQNSTCNIRTKFGTSDNFKKSIDARIMFDTLDNDYYCGNKRAKAILEAISKEAPNQKLDLWRNEISTLFLREEIKKPADIILKLRAYLYDLHHPIQQSSVSIGDSLGFSLSSLI